MCEEMGRKQLVLGKSVRQPEVKLLLLMANKIEMKNLPISILFSLNVIKPEKQMSLIKM